MADKHNKKLPKAAVDEGDIEPKYGYVFGEWDSCGGHNWVYRNPAESDKTYSQTITPTCNYTITSDDSDKKSMFLSFSPGQHHTYVAGGKSIHADGHYDFNAESTARFESTEVGIAAEKNRYDGAGGSRITVHKDGLHMTGGGSDGTTSRGTKGNERNTVKGKKFLTVEDDAVDSYQKKHVKLVGDDAAENYGANYDVYIKEKVKYESGDKFKIKTANTLDTVSEKATTMTSNDTMTFTSSKDMTANTQQKYSVSAEQDMSFKTQANFTANVQGNFKAKAQGQIELDGQGGITFSDSATITIKVGSSQIKISSSGIEISGSQIKVNASGALDLQGSPTKVNGGGSPAIPFTVP